MCPEKWNLEPSNNENSSSMGSFPGDTCIKLVRNHNHSSSDDTDQVVMVMVRDHVSRYMGESKAQSCIGSGLFLMLFFLCYGVSLCFPCIDPLLFGRLLLWLGTFLSRR